MRCAVVLLALVSLAHGYFIHIDANEEQCFFDRVTSGTKLGLMFEVAEGGFLDIDVKVCLALAFLTQAILLTLVRNRRCLRSRYFFLFLASSASYRILVDMSKLILS